MTAIRKEYVNRVLFPPWFLTREVSYKIQSMVPQSYRSRMRLYFDLYGCVSCGKNRRQYYSVGLCKPCSCRIRVRLHRCDKIIREAMEHKFVPTGQRIFESATSAKRALADLVDSSFCKRAMKAAKIGRPRPTTLTLRGISNRSAPFPLQYHLDRQKHRGY